METLKKSRMNDINEAEDVEIRIRADGKVLWVNVDERCECRINQIKRIHIEDERRDETMEENLNGGDKNGTSKRMV